MNFMPSDTNTNTSASSATADYTIITKDRTIEELFLLQDELLEQQCLAIDCEGVDLARSGIISLVQIATPVHCYLFDVLGVESDHVLMRIIKRLFEDELIVKIIHDCKMDSDALYNQHQIDLKNIHDTQAWDITLFHNEGRSLNHTLESYNCPVNADRNSDMYKQNHAIWQTRPLSPELERVAAGDVQGLFALRQAQITLAETLSPIEVEKCKMASQRNVEVLRKAVVEFISIDSEKIGLFIGTKGKNLKRIREKYSCFFYNQGPRHMNHYIVFAPDMTRMKALLKDLRRRELIVG